MNRILKMTLLGLLFTGLAALPVFALPTANTGYIYIGDSRFAYMDNDLAFSSAPNVFNVSVPGEGYWWLTNIAQPFISNIKQSNPQITTWYEIYNLGVNDLASIDYYVQYYQNRALFNRVVLVSVNPVENCNRADNPSIEYFNSRLRATNLAYIDCYSYLRSTAYGTYDGIHYTPETNRAIYNYIDSSMTLYTAAVK